MKPAIKPTAEDQYIDIARITPLSKAERPALSSHLISVFISYNTTIYFLV